MPASPPAQRLVPAPCPEGREDGGRRRRGPPPPAKPPLLASTGKAWIDGTDLMACTYICTCQWWSNGGTYKTPRWSSSTQPSKRMRPIATASVT
jgi:hypothetical protein